MGKKLYLDGHIESLDGGQVLVAYASEDLYIVVDSLRVAYRDIIEQDRISDKENARLVTIRESLYPALIGHLLRARPEDTAAARLEGLEQAFRERGLLFIEVL